MTETIPDVPDRIDQQQLAQQLVEAAGAEGVELVGPAGCCVASRRSLGLARRSTATSCRSTRSSMSVLEAVQPISKTSPSTCRKIRYSSRSGWARRRSRPTTLRSRSSLVSGCAEFWNPHEQHDPTQHAGEHQADESEGHSERSFCVGQDGVAEVGRL
jgi:hypothetical protein